MMFSGIDLSWVFSDCLQSCKSRRDTSLSPPPPNNFHVCLVCPEIFPPCCNGKYIGGRKMQDGKN